jgi:lipoprotein-releasing system permease protein
VAASGFEWYVAWRHLREDPSRRPTRRTMLVGLTMLAVGLGWLALARFGPAAIDRLLRIGPLLEMRIEGTPYVDWLKGAAVGAIALGLLLTILGWLFASFTVFTAISMFGVFLGTGAPIIALSVMSGFEADLKSKIRATKADIVISAGDDRPFTNWTEVQDKIAPIKGVVDSMAYIESEVIVKHASNPAGMGIILRGIDATRAPRVLDLARKMSEGKVEYLLTPDKIPPEDIELIPGSANWGLEPERGEATSGASARAAKGGDAKAGESKKGTELARKGEKGGATTPVPSPPGILLGDELYARTLHVFVGSDVDVACPMCGVGPTGPIPRLRSFRVAGHFYTGMYEFDSKLAYVSLGEAQKFLNMRGEVTGVEVRTVDPDRARGVAEEIVARVGPGFEVRTWEDLNRGLFMALRLEKIAMFVVLTFIALVASFSIISNLIMLVTEKAQEVAILKSMGARDTAILRVFFAEGLYIGLVGLALGLTIGISGCLLLSRFGLPIDPDLYYIQRLPVVMRVSEIGLVSVAALGLCCLATIYPAYVASRMRPVEGLRYE